MWIPPGAPGSRLMRHVGELCGGQGRGLRRTNADKDRAVQAALKHPNGAARSNREIGRYLGVDEKTVGCFARETGGRCGNCPVTQRTGVGVET